MKDRHELRAIGAGVRQQLFAAEPAQDGAACTQGFDDLVTEVTFGSIWSRPGLTMKERSLVTVTALFCRGQTEQLRRYLQAGLRAGATPVELQEVLIQCGIYAGFSASEQALAVAREVFAAQGLGQPEDLRREDALTALSQRGADVMKALHGERRHEGHAAPDNPMTKSFYPLVAQYCYGEIWERPGLDRRLRALCGVAAFAALGYAVLLRKFALSALNVGATRDEVIETIIQIGPYSGFATTLNGLAQVGEAFAQDPTAPKP